MSHIAVIDIGKTNAKLALVDPGSLSEIAVITRPNAVLPGPPWPHFDVAGHWAFILQGLAQFQRDHGIAAISVTTHGACGVLLDGAGELAAPVLDYEHPGPDESATAYDALRPAFEVTGSPRLPGGLNLGAQLYWMAQRDPGLLARTRTVLTYPQYWGFRLTGVRACDVSSLGCHTDLWDPARRDFSPLVGALGLGGKMAPARPAGDVLGPVLPEIAARTGLPRDTPVTCGIHDSNASLYPHLMAQEPPFSVVSTGTWVIAMAVGGAPVALDPGRDTLINVNAFGDPVPSARFMGGRAFETIIAGQFAEPSADEIDQILTSRTMLLPSVVQGSGPYPSRAATWRGPEPRLGTGARMVAGSFYLAMMTATCLGLIGHRGDIVVEGPFAGNLAFCRLLSAATTSPVLRTEATTGTSQGAALLVTGEPPKGMAHDAIRETSPEMQAYATRWTELADEVTGRARCSHP